MADGNDDASVVYETLVDLPAATFPTDPQEIYRVQLHAPHDRYVFKLWLESTRSKEQWTTRVTDLREHAPDAVMLPLSIVLSCLERSLVEQAHVDVLPRSDGSLSLKLTIEVEFAAPIVYVFDMPTVGVDLVHILEAKMRDCDAAIGALSSSSKSKDVVIAKLFGMLESVKTDVAQLRGMVGRDQELAAVMPHDAVPQIVLQRTFWSAKQRPSFLTLTTCPWRATEKRASGT
ncbi:hypothetical protein SPRG_13399 [Saprolegnia parasitica CBS 223.65]|uniref:Uncharacterized protein n=1 Tax=Saprolegnia parasitica (strain CBS 223.65) TaxID=695850 RepID=A0A067C270_SAPPC|nr:hypothetical protein SPRG_13399 [Saprolegnia parasitica CBS 223.65]KDO20646.1 hypothetical protein SPRG_13399 [Saprolegnia parasitica CBS 223.65]|eukprot:XP_012208612.1 hypothetical protein SPRG_13399 [Saprolegnia parasitica CBS 223.65]